jgi:hypothetical protein
MLSSSQSVLLEMIGLGEVPDLMSQATKLCENTDREAAPYLQPTHLMLITIQPFFRASVNSSSEKVPT